MSTIERYELKRLTSDTLGNIDKRPGVYAVYCPNSGMVKFGRASSLRDRLKTYSDMCLAAGYVIVFIKYLAHDFTTITEKLILAFANQKFHLITKQEYFSVDCEEKVLMTMEFAISRLSALAVTKEDVMQVCTENIKEKYLALYEEPNLAAFNDFVERMNVFILDWIHYFERVKKLDYKQLELDFSWS